MLHFERGVGGWVGGLDGWVGGKTGPTCLGNAALSSLTEFLRRSSSTLPQPHTSIHPPTHPPTHLFGEGRLQFFHGVLEQVVVHCDDDHIETLQGQAIDNGTADATATACKGKGSGWVGGWVDDFLPRWSSAPPPSCRQSTRGSLAGHLPTHPLTYL